MNFSMMLFELVESAQPNAGDVHELDICADQPRQGVNVVLVPSIRPGFANRCESERKTLHGHSEPHCLFIRKTAPLRLCRQFPKCCRIMPFRYEGPENESEAPASLSCRIRIRLGHRRRATPTHDAARREPTDWRSGKGVGTRAI